MLPSPDVTVPLPLPVMETVSGNSGSVPRGSIQFRMSGAATRVYTPGFFARAQPMPHDVIPASRHSAGSLSLTGERGLGRSRERAARVALARVDRRPPRGPRRPSWRGRSALPYQSPWAQVAVGDARDTRLPELVGDAAAFRRRPPARDRKIVARRPERVVRAALFPDQLERLSARGRARRLELEHRGVELVGAGAVARVVGVARDVERPTRLSSGDACPPAP